MDTGFWKRHIILVVPDYVFTLGYRYLGVMMFGVSWRGYLIFAELVFCSLVPVAQLWQMWGP